MKRALIASILVLALSISGCQSASRTPPGSQPDDAGSLSSHIETADPKQTSVRYHGADPNGQTISFWHAYSSTQQMAMQALVDRFNQTNPHGITVVPESQGSYQDVFARTLDAIRTPKVPDLILAFQNHAADLFLRNALVDMNLLIEHPEWGFSPSERADFFPGIFAQDEPPVFPGVRLGFPLSRSVDLLAYNDEWLSELGYASPPASLEDFKEMACAASRNPFSASQTNESQGYALSTDASRFATWLFAFDGVLFDEATNRFTLNSNEAVEAMTFLQTMAAEGCADLTNERYGDLSDFASGGLLFSIGSSAGLPAYEVSVLEGADFDWAATLLPAVDGEPVPNAYGPSVSILRSTPERELAAWMFVQYVAGAEAQAEWAAATGAYPVRARATEKMAGCQGGHSACEAVIRQLNRVRTEPSVPGYDLVRQEIESAMEAIMSGADVRATLDALNQTANAIVSGLISPER